MSAAADHDGTAVPNAAVEPSVPGRVVEITAAISSWLDHHDALGHSGRDGIEDCRIDLDGV